MTLVEMMIVVVIMALLATGVAVLVMPLLVDAQVKQAGTDASAIRTAAAIWRMRGSSDCPSVDDLIDDHLLSRETRSRDPWDQPFVVTCEPDSVHVVSAGPDRRLGTEDDVPVEDA